MANFDPNNKVHLILFFTDSLDLCLRRADIRHKSGGHLVKPEIVTEMYENTIPLLKNNFSLFKSMRFVDITNDNISKVVIDNPPNWMIDNDLVKYL